MIESIFQTFFFLATFDTILISVSIANYAISASFLGRETRLTRRRMEKRKQELDVRIKELQNKGLSIEDLEEETTKAKDDMNALKRRLFFLSWIGAVLVPSSLFVVSLVLSVLGINSDILLTDLGITGPTVLVADLMFFSVVLLAFGFFFLLLVIRAIDSAARKIPIPEFEVYFKNLLETAKCKRKQMLVITLCINNKGEDLAEDALVMVHFPPAFQVQPMGYRTYKQGPETNHPDYNSAIFDVKRIYPDTIFNIDITITTPDANEIHEIYVSIYETKSGHSEYKLTIQTTD
jgi:hypothetical protein